MKREDILLIILVVLVFICSFGYGYLWGMDEGADIAWKHFITKPESTPIDTPVYWDENWHKRRSQHAYDNSPTPYPTPLEINP